MCNQAADLDSIACCISLAVSLDAASFVPIPRNEYPLRVEAEWLLERCGIPLSSIAFLGDIDPSEAEQIVLVDHNVLPPEYEALAPKITEIIDHHKDECRLAAAKTIVPTGSCATLVGKRLLENRTSGKPALPQNLAVLLLGAILIDTRCLAQRHPTTELDRSIAVQLAEISGCNSRALYDELWRRKSDLSLFTPEELLRKDYKEITASGVKVGFCAIYGALESISGDLMGEAEVFRRSRQLDHLVLMSAYYEGEELHKELAFLPDCSWNQEALAYLNSKGTQLEPKTVIGNIQVYNQRNTDYSRKQILPFIKELLKKARNK